MESRREKSLIHHPPKEKVDYALLASRVDESESTVREDLSAVKSKTLAEKQLLVHHGNDETVDVVDYVLNPTTNIVVLVSFTVPRGQVAYFDQVGVYYSEPMICACLHVGWRLSISGSQAPNIAHITERWRFSNYGDIAQPMRINPLWVQSGQTVMIELQPFWGVVNYTEHLTVIGRLTGRIYKPASPSLIDGPYK